MVSQDHYFTPDPTVASRPRTIRVTLADLSFELDTDRGVFAHGHLDFGTDLLLRTLPPVPAGEVIDVGCGYGAIAITVALRNPDARVWAVDVNRRALDLCARNAERAGARNVVTAEPDAVPGGIRFAAVYSKPTGQARQRRASRAAPHLDRTDPARSRGDPGGPAHLGADSLAGWLAGLGHRVRTGQVEGRLSRPRGACGRLNSAS